MTYRFLNAAIFFTAVLLRVGIAPADTVELRSGSQIEGIIVSRDAKGVTVEVEVNGRSVSRSFPRDRVVAITVDGKREVLGEQAATSSTSSSSTAANGKAPKERTAAEVESLIDEQGRTPPKWFEETPLNYPKNLKLTWALPPPTRENMDPQRNLRMYVWSVVMPNPKRWHEGIKLMHHLIAEGEDSDEVKRRAMDQLD